MGMLRFDHVGVVVEDLEAVTAFFLALEFEREGGGAKRGAGPRGLRGSGGIIGSSMACAKEGEPKNVLSTQRE